MSEPSPYAPDPIRLKCKKKGTSPLYDETGASTLSPKSRKSPPLIRQVSTHPGSVRGPPDPFTATQECDDDNRDLNYSSLQPQGGHSYEAPAGADTREGGLGSSYLLRNSNGGGDDDSSDSDEYDSDMDEEAGMMALRDYEHRMEREADRREKKEDRRVQRQAEKILTELQPRPMVPRSHFQRVEASLQKERIDFLKETLSLRQHIFRMERREKTVRDQIGQLQAQLSRTSRLLQRAQSQQQPHQPLTAPASGPSVVQTDAQEGSASNLSVSNLNEGTPVQGSDSLSVTPSALPQPRTPTASSVPRSTSPSHAPVNISPSTSTVTIVDPLMTSTVPTQSLQLVAIDEITKALSAAEQLEVGAELRKQQLSDLKHEYDAKVSDLKAAHVTEVADLKREVRDQKRAVEAIKGTIDVERIRFQQRAEAAAEETLDALKAKNATLHRNLAALNEKLSSTESELQHAITEDGRHVNSLSQLQQQLTTMSQERAEMKAALVAMNTEVNKMNVVHRTQEAKISSLEAEKVTMEEELRANGGGDYQFMERQNSQSTIGLGNGGRNSTVTGGGGRGRKNTTFAAVSQNSFNPGKSQQLANRSTRLQSRAFGVSLVAGDCRSPEHPGHTPVIPPQAPSPMHARRDTGKKISDEFLSRVASTARPTGRKSPSLTKNAMVTRRISSESNNLMASITNAELWSAVGSNRNSPEQPSP